MPGRGHNLTVSLSGLAVVLWECYVPDPHRLINIMYCFLASLHWAVPGPAQDPQHVWHVLYAQREKAAMEKETSPRRQSAASSSRILSAICCPPFKFYDDAPAKAKDSLGLFADYMRVSTDTF